MIAVMDCSAAAALLLEEGAADEVEQTLANAARAKAKVIVPSVFWFEIGNVLVQAERRKRIPKGEAARIETLLVALPVETDGPPSRRTIARIREIAMEHGLTSYDAAYVELADRVGAKLLTHDADILRLARRFPFIR